MTQDEIRVELEKLARSIPILKAAEEAAAKAEIEARSFVDDLDWLTSRHEKPVADMAGALANWERTRNERLKAEAELAQAQKQYAALTWMLEQLKNRKRPTAA